MDGVVFGATGAAPTPLTLGFPDGVAEYELADNVYRFAGWLEVDGDLADEAAKITGGNGRPPRP